MPDTRDLLRHGLRLARARGLAEPGPREAVWELLVEAAETLARLPDRERRWLTSGTRSSHPDVVHDLVEVFAAAVGRGGWDRTRVRPAPPSPGAISRLDRVLTWPAALTGRQRARDLRVLFALAAGVPVRVIRARLGCGRQTVYDIRKRALDDIVAWLAADGRDGGRAVTRPPARARAAPAGARS